MLACRQCPGRRAPSNLAAVAVTVSCPARYPRGNTKHLESGSLPRPKLAAIRLFPYPQITGFGRALYPPGL